jgi:hypothetical protein
MFLATGSTSLGWVMRMIGLVLFFALAIQAAESGLPPSQMVSGPKEKSSLETVTRSWTKTTGYAFDLSGVDGTLEVVPFGSKPFWSALEELNQQTKTRISLKENGKLIALRPASKGKAVTQVQGPFRFVGREVRCKRDLESGLNSYEALLELHWEPRFEFFRCDDPLIQAAKDDTGKSLTSPHFKVFKSVSGYVTPLKVPLSGLTRESQSFDLEGLVTVTIAEEMLLFTIPDLTRSQKLEQKRVGVTFRSSKREGKNLVCTLELHYPEGGSTFESFETYWLRANEFTLIDASGKRYPVEQFESTGNLLTYYLQESSATGKLPESLTGWKAEVRTPGVIRDVKVPFQLRGWELP